MGWLIFMMKIQIHFILSHQLILEKLENRIVICGREITSDADSVFNEKALRDDNVLCESIVEYGNEIIKNGGEIFRREKNIIATSEGYFFAFYESELREV